MLTQTETPRWLIAKDRREEAIAVMAKYHGDGNPNDPIVQLQLREITEDMAVTRNDNPWWDFRELGNTAAARYRLYMVILMSFFGQWSGNNVSLSSSLTLPSELSQLTLPRSFRTSCHRW